MGITTWLHHKPIRVREYNDSAFTVILTPSTQGNNLLNKSKIFIALLLVFTINCAIPQVQVSLQQPPPNQFKLEHMWKVTLNNLTKETFRVYLYGKATESRAGFIVDAKTASFSLPPGFKRVTAGDIGPIDVLETNKKYEKIVLNTGNVPSGDYLICITVRNALTEEELGTDCVEQEVFNFTQLVLLSPSDNSTVEDFFPVFNWLPPVPLNINQTAAYTLQIAEILSRQSAYDAMQSNPLFLEANNLYSAIYQFQVSARSFIRGRRYAWRVRAFLGNVLISESEIWEFKYESSSERLNSEMDKHSKTKMEVGTSPALEQGGLPSWRQKAKERLFLFSGNSKVEGLNSNRPGTGQTIPQRYANWEINPGVSIYKIPFSLNVLLSTQGNDLKQNINSIGLLLKPENIQQIAQEKAQEKVNELLKKALDETDAVKKKQYKESADDIRNKPQSVLSGPLKVFSYFKSLGIGVTYPQYSSFILSGVPVTGADIEFNPGLFYVAVTGLKSQKPVGNISYRRNLYAGRLGIGPKEKSHFYLTFLHARDDENSIIVSDTNITLTPKSNYLFGTEGKLTLFKSMFSIEGEAEVSVLTRDVRDADLLTTEIPDWIKNIVHPKISSSVDITYSIKSSFNNDKTNTRISAGFKMIGPGYMSLGVPNLASDKMAFDIRVEQKFMDRRISVNTYFKRDRDNLLDWKTSTTKVTAFGLNVGFNFRNYPFVRLLYTPYFQRNNAANDTFRVDNSAQIFTFVSGYNFRKWDLNFSNSLSYSLQQNKSFASLNDFTTHNLMFVENVSFKFPLTVAAGVGMIFQKLPGGSARIITLDFSGSYTVFNVWNNTAGLNLGVEKDKNNKLGMYVNSSVTFLKYLTLDVRAEQNIYRDWLLTGNGYNEFILRSILSANW